MATRFDPSKYQRSKRYKLNGKIYKITISKEGWGTLRPHCISGDSFRFWKEYNVMTDDGWKFLHGSGCNYRQ